MQKLKVSVENGAKVDGEWAHVGGKDLESLLAQVKPRLASVWAWDRERQRAHRLGTAFKVRHAVSEEDGARYAYFVTNEHVIEGALQIVDERAFEGRSNLFSPPLAQLLGPLNKQNVLHLCLCDKPVSDSYAVTAISLNTRADLCLLQVRCPNSRPENDYFAINSDPLEPGTMVVFTGFAPSKGELGGVPTRGATWSSDYKLECIIAQVVSVEGRLRHKPVFGYEINAPLPAGMSGSPVFAFEPPWLADDGRGPAGRFSPLSVVGICMSDSNENQARDVRKAGSSFVIGSQNLHVLIDLLGGDLVQQWQQFFDDRAKGLQPSVPSKPLTGKIVHDLGKRRSELMLGFDVASEYLEVRRL